MSSSPFTLADARTSPTQDDATTNGVNNTVTTAAAKDQDGFIDPANDVVMSFIDLTLLDRFTISNYIDQGRFSLIFAADDKETSQQVAVKIQKPCPLTANHDSPNDAYVAVLRSEDYVLQALQLKEENDDGSNGMFDAHHIYIPQRIMYGNRHVDLATAEYNNSEPLEFLVMELLGDPISTARRQRQYELQMSNSDMLEWSIRVCVNCLQALQHLHRHGFIHRDVRPNNFLLRRKHDAATTTGNADENNEKIDEQDYRLLREQGVNIRCSVHHNSIQRGNEVLVVDDESDGLNDNAGSDASSDSDMDVVIIDYGLAKKIRDEKGNLRPPREHCEFRGSSMYASLTAHDCKELSQQDDVWSWLWLTLEMITGSLPWSARHYRRQRVLIGGCKNSMLKNAAAFPPALRSTLQSIIKHLNTLSYGMTPNYGNIANELTRLLSTHRSTPIPDSDLQWPTATLEFVRIAAVKMGIVGEPSSPADDATSVQDQSMMSNGHDDIDMSHESADDNELPATPYIPGQSHGAAERVRSMEMDVVSYITSELKDSSDQSRAFDDAPFEPPDVHSVAALEDDEAAAEESTEQPVVDLTEQKRAEGSGKRSTKIPKKQSASSTHHSSQQVTVKKEPTDSPSQRTERESSKQRHSSQRREEGRERQQRSERDNSREKEREKQHTSTKPRASDRTSASRSRESAHRASRVRRVEDHRAANGWHHNDMHSDRVARRVDVRDEDWGAHASPPHQSRSPLYWYDDRAGDRERMLQLDRERERGLDRLREEERLRQMERARIREMERERERSRDREALMDRGPGRSMEPARDRPAECGRGRDRIIVITCDRTRARARHMHTVPEARTTERPVPAPSPASSRDRVMVLKDGQVDRVPVRIDHEMQTRAIKRERHSASREPLLSSLYPAHVEDDSVRYYESDSRQSASSRGVIDLRRGEADYDRLHQPRSPSPLPRRDLDIRNGVRSPLDVDRDDAFRYQQRERVAERPRSPIPFVSTAPIYLDD